MVIGITGGCGYVGSILSPLLAQLADRIELIDLRAPAPSVLAQFGEGKVAYHHADVSDPSAAEALFGRYDAIVHLAALVGYPACRANPALAHRWNVVSTDNVVRFKRKQAPIVFASTISVYGDQTPGELVTEHSETHPNSEYGKTKLQAERLLLATRENVVLRFAGSFGCSPRMRHDVLIHDFIFKATRQEMLSVFEDSFIRQFVHVVDMAEAIRFAVDHARDMGGEVFNVGNPSVEITKRELVELIASQVPFPHTFDDSGKDLERRNYRVSFEKLLRLGYQPHVTLETGVAELLRHYQQIQPEELAHVG